MLLKTIVDTSEDVKSNALIEIPPDTLVGTDAETNKDILVAAMAAALLQRLD